MHPNITLPNVHSLSLANMNIQGAILASVIKEENLDEYEEEDED